MIPVPPMGAVDDVVVDRRTGESWTVRVEPFELAEGVVTCEEWDQTLGLPSDPAFAGHPRTGVSWREAITFCNRLSIREGLEPAYEISQRIVAEPTQWRPSPPWGTQLCRLHRSGEHCHDRDLRGQRLHHFLIHPRRQKRSFGAGKWPSL